MNEDRAKQIFKDSGTVTMPTGVTVSDIRAYHDEEKRFAEMKKAQKENPATSAIPATSAPRTAFADVPPANRAMRSRGFGAGGRDVGDDLPEYTLPLPVPAAPAPDTTATPIAEAETVPTTPANKTVTDGDSNQPG